jgi:type III secretion protein W
MKIVIDFILHALGQDLKSKGPSIDKGELHRLLTEGRSMQAILGIFKFFRGRMPLISQSFQRQTIQLPLRLNFEQMAKVFMILLQERYPSPDKVLQMGASLGLPEDIVGQIIIYTQMRDALRQTAPKLFRSEQHRQDVLKSIIQAIEKLDEQLEEEEEKNDEEQS